jgi:hypothetical protein
MSRPPHIEHDPPPKSTERALFFALLGPAIAWSAAQLVSVSAIGRVCRAQQFAPWQWALVMSIEALAIAVTIACVIVAFRTFKRRTGNASAFAAEGSERVEFLSQVALFGGSILLVNIVMFGLAPLIIDSCVGASG